jgi:hypothetical protein
MGHCKILNAESCTGWTVHHMNIESNDMIQFIRDRDTLGGKERAHNLPLRIEHTTWYCSGRLNLYRVEEACV